MINLLIFGIGVLIFALFAMAAADTRDEGDKVKAENDAEGNDEHFKNLNGYDAGPSGIGLYFNGVRMDEDND